MTALEKYKAGIRRRAATDRTEMRLRYERAAARAGTLLGAIAAPFITVGRRVGPVPVGGALGIIAVAIDIILLPEGILWSFALGVVEGIGLVDATAAIAAARTAP